MPRLPRQFVVAFSCLCFALPSSLRAQDAFGVFSSLVKRVRNLNIYVMTSAPSLKPLVNDGVDVRPELSAGVGFELLLSVYEWGAKETSTATAATPGKLTEIQVTSGDTVRRYAPAPPLERDNPWSFELGIAYNDQPFRLVSATYEIRGALRDQPAITLYLSWTAGALSPYGGLRFSSYSLSSARAFIEPAATESSMRVIPVSSSAFAVAGVGGLALSIEFVNLFVESEFARRTFQSLQWPENTPATFPRSLRVESPSLWAGVSVDLGDIFKGN